MPTISPPPGDGCGAVSVKFSAAVAVLPARSVASPVTLCFMPSVVSRTGGVQVSIPDRASVQLKFTVTSVLFQPLAFGAGAAAPVIVGLSVSNGTLT